MPVCVGGRRTCYVKGGEGKRKWFSLYVQRWILAKCGCCSFLDQVSHIILTHRRERKKYYLHREKARAQPEKYLTIIIDGMDQSKTNVPLLLKEAKSTQNLYRLRTHLSGALVHTRSPHGKVIYAFYDIMQWPHDSNLCIQVLSSILYDFRDKLPTVLYLQLDNCFRENKNRFVLGFCALLVQKGVFKKVKCFQEKYTVHA